MLHPNFRPRSSLLAAVFLAACSVGAERPEPVTPAGFTSLFDGQTLTGWRGDPARWSVRDGAITGEAKERLQHTTFLVRDEPYADFELHFQFRISEKGNSGVQFRSRLVNDERFEVAGYQANVVSAIQEVRYGMIYDYLGQNEIALLGENIVISQRDGKLVRDVRSGVNPVATLLETYRPYPGWNDYVVIAHGNRIVHAINGYLALHAVDERPDAARTGILGLQIDHFGTPMLVQFKDLRIRSISAFPDISRFITAPGPAETTAAIPPRPGAR